MTMVPKVLHLVREADAPPPPAEVVRPDEDRRLVIDEVAADELLDAVFAAELVVVW
jgi:hypothetical protein